MRIGGMSQEVKSTHLVKIYQQLIQYYIKFEINIDLPLDMYYFREF